MTRTGTAGNAGARFSIGLRPRPIPELYRMFIFLSQCNKKCTSFPDWVRGSAVVGRPTAPVDRGMLYVAYQMHTDIMVPVRTWAGMVVNSGGAPLLSDHPAMRNLTAVYELIARAGLTHTRPPFGIGSMMSVCN